MPIRLPPACVPSREEISQLSTDMDAANPPVLPTQGDAATQPEPPFLSLREAAEWLCISQSTLKRLIANGTLGTLRVGSRRKILASTLAAYVARDILLPDQVQDTNFPM
jgi:excisionase family DNA binding protein